MPHLILLMRTGEIMTTKKLDIQNAALDTAIVLPRVASGEHSTGISQGILTNPILNTVLNTNKNTVAAYPALDELGKAIVPANTAMQSVWPIAENNKSGRRPTRSIRGIGSSVASQYSRPLNPDMSDAVLRDIPMVF